MKKSQRQQFKLINETLEKMCELIKEINENERLRQNRLSKPEYLKGGIISRTFPDSEPIIRK